MIPIVTQELHVLEKLSEQPVRFIRNDCETINLERIALPFSPDQNQAYCDVSPHKFLGNCYTPFRQGMRDSYAYHRRVKAQRESLRAQRSGE